MTTEGTPAGGGRGLRKEERRRLLEERRARKQAERAARKQGGGGRGPVFMAAAERATVTDAPAIIVRDVRVEFRPYIESRPTLRRALKPGRRRTAAPVVALDGVSLEIRKGEAFGVIGSNGAGKSTLMQVLAGTLVPDAGEVEIYGSSPSLLALGVGFNRQLSGRRNVMLGGLASGLRKSEVDERFDEVVEFADIGSAIERPVYTYSSGMYARLAFAVAMQARPDILLVDELFAVGDESFRVKSAKAMEGILHDAGTIVMVSHGLGRMQRFCDRLAWMDRGKVMQVGDPEEVVAAYRSFTGVRPEDVDDGDDIDEMLGD